MGYCGLNFAVDTRGEPETPVGGPTLVWPFVLGFGGDSQHAVIPRDVGIPDIEAKQFHAQYELPVCLVQFVVVTACFEERSRQI